MEPAALNLLEQVVSVPLTQSEMPQPTHPDMQHLTLRAPLLQLGQL